MITQEIKNKVAQIVALAVKHNILYFVLHYVGVANADTTAKNVNFYHRIRLGWSHDGYHLFLNDTGLIEDLEPIGNVVFGCKRSGWSKYSNEEWIGVKSLHLCYETLAGYLMSGMQSEVLEYLCKELIKAIPNILIGGHREFPDLTQKNRRQNTLCPGISVEHWLEKRGIKDKNIFYRVWKPPF